LLSRLEEPLRTVVERVVLAGWSYRRTAELLQVSPMTVQRRLRRGLEQLRRLLSPGAAGPRLAASGGPGC
ncbi:MAG: sigma factor-like helix-turn-helix DNA-binding protein, partial [Prochlorococcaceae cyanobacterium]